MPSQRNKAHKPGRKAGKSAREKHRLAKGEQRNSVKHASNKFGLNKTERLNAAKQQRDQKREALLSQRRQIGAPKVVAILPMSEGVAIDAFWNHILGACEADAQQSSKVVHEVMGGIEQSFPQRPTLAALPSGQKGQIYWLPPIQRRNDPFVAVELARHAEAVLLVFGSTGDVDESAQQVLAILREFGLPTLVPVVLPPRDAPLKVRAASKKLAASALEIQGLVGHKVHVAGKASDYHQLLRHLAEASPKLPTWRQQRPSLLVEAAEFQSKGSEGSGTLVLRGFVRALGLSANQAIHVPEAGDFQIEKIEGPSRPQPVAGWKGKGDSPSNPQGMDVDGRQLPVLAVADRVGRESLQRENEPDPLDAEQTWPTEEELAEAAMDVESRKRKLPKGTSEYQAAWILDEEFSSDEDVEEVDLQASKSAPSRAQSVKGTEAGDWDADLDDDDEMSYGPTEEDSIAGNSKKPSLKDQQDELQFPDEVDTPEDIPARQRFSKYRGLKSWRTSPWDPKESLPQEYARIFAFQNMRRAEKRAKEAARRVGSVDDAHGVPPGSYVAVCVENVPHAAAAAIAERVTRSAEGLEAPVVAFGLLQHETRLSVLNFGVKKAGNFEQPLPNKAPLLFVTGHRTYSARPIFSADDHAGTKFKMERFLHPGQSAVASVYAPIAYPTLPLLAFHRHEHGEFQLALTGTLRSANPDRVILKRIVLSGYPVRVHKKKAVVRWMFHNPDDVRWFKPLELWTKHGRRGRIREPVGTHGAMKCLFDSPTGQQDAVCASLYKRVFPKWPESMDFTLKSQTTANK